MLLEDIFRDYLQHMVTIVINPKGTGKLNFWRVDEYALFCVPDLGTSIISGQPTLAAAADEDEPILPPTMARTWTSQQTLDFPTKRQNFPSHPRSVIFGSSAMRAAAVVN